MLHDGELERRRKISETLKGRAPWNKGIKSLRAVSEETRRKIGLAHKGKKVFISPETRLKISLANKGRMPKNLAYLHSIPYTEERKAKIGNANRGRRHTPESKRKISEAKRNPLRPLYKAVRECYKSDEWRKGIFKRDNFTCVLCGVRGGVLNADHHPKRFVDILRDNGTTTLDEALELNELWSLDCGRTLCFKCHCQTETFGNKFKRTA